MAMNKLPATILTTLTPVTNDLQFDEHCLTTPEYANYCRVMESYIEGEINNVTKEYYTIEGRIKWKYVAPVQVIYSVLYMVKPSMFHTVKEVLDGSALLNQLVGRNIRYKCPYSGLQTPKQKGCNMWPEEMIKNTARDTLLAYLSRLN